MHTKSNKKLFSNKSKRINTSSLVFLLLLLFILPLSVILAQQKQNMFSFAINSLESIPPIFFCLEFGRATNQQCASLYFKTETSYTLYGFPMADDKTVYLGDRIIGSTIYTNTSDLPFSIKTLDILAETNKGNYHVLLKPTQGQIVLEPGYSLGISDASYRFDAPDPQGQWITYSSVTNTHGQTLNELATKHFSLNSSCSALRAQELTANDKTSLRSFCSSNPKDGLCTSRQYCEIMTGSDTCTQALASPQVPGQQCDEGIIIPIQEQNLLENFCKAYPTSDECKTFCDRTLNSPICPARYASTTNASMSTLASAAPNESYQAVDAAAVAPAPNVGPPYNTVCRPGQLFNYLHQCCATGWVLCPNAQGNNICATSCAAKPATPGKTTAPAPGKPATPAPATGTGSCKNYQGVTCKYCPLTAAKLCPAAPGAAAPAVPPPPPITRATCPVKNSIGQCCRTGWIVVNGLCAAPGTGAAPAPAAPAGPVCGAGGGTTFGSCNNGYSCVGTANGTGYHCTAPTAMCKGPGVACSIPADCCSNVCNAIPLITSNTCK